MNILIDSIDEEIDMCAFCIFLNLQAVVALTALMSTSSPESRNPSVFGQRLDWAGFVETYEERGDFKSHLVLSLSSFEKLLALIRDDLEVDKEKASLRGGPISPELCLYATLRYLKGSSYSDIRAFTGISTASIHRVTFKTIKAINKCEALALKFPQTVEECEAAAGGFRRVSTHGCISNCVSVLDGYHLQIQSPSKKEVKDVRSFFSGHHQTFGVNIQAACDHNCRFQFLDVAGPGGMEDTEAVYEAELGGMIEALPGQFCAIGDCAYRPTEHLVPIFGGDQALVPQNDNFNFYASKLRKRIELAFGLMIKKWAILSHPLTNKVENVKHIVLATARLHNFCINERLQGRDKPFSPRHVELPPLEQANRATAAMYRYKLDEMTAQSETLWSRNRDRMAESIEALQLTRPGHKRKCRDNNDI